MPIYSYQCEDCGAHQERIVRMSDRDIPQSCKFCGGRLAKQLDAPKGFQGLSTPGRKYGK